MWTMIKTSTFATMFCAAAAATLAPINTPEARADRGCYAPGAFGSGLRINVSIGTPVVVAPAPVVVYETRRPLIVEPGCGERVIVTERCAPPVIVERCEPVFVRPAYRPVVYAPIYYGPRFHDHGRFDRRDWRRH